MVLFLSANVSLRRSKNHQYIFKENINQKLRLNLQFRKINFMCDSALYQNSSLTINVSSPQWQGSKPQKFNKGKRIYISKDLIQDCTNMPNQTIHTGRHHYANQYSPEYQFKRQKREASWDQHWYPRASQIKTFDFKPSNPPQRPERRHVNLMHNPQSRHESIRTSFIQKYTPTNQYIVEDKMQRKIRIEPLELKKKFYKDLNIFKKPRNF